MDKQAAGKRIRLPAPQAFRRCTRLLIGGTEFDPLAGYFKRRWRNGKRARFLPGTGRGSTPRRRTQEHAPLEERLTHLALNQEIPGSAPGRST